MLSLPAHFRAGETGGDSHEHCHHHYPTRGLGSPRYCNSALAAQNVARSQSATALLSARCVTSLDSGIAELYQLPITSFWREDLSGKDLRLGRSVLALSVMAFAVSVVCGAGNFGNSANAQAASAPAPQASMPVQRSFSQQALENSARNIIARFDLGRTSSNPDGIPISQWTAQDFFKFSDDNLFSIRAMFSDERYDLIDQIKPTSMNREQFSRAILRESARRGIVDNPYERRFSSFPQGEVNVMRPLGVSLDAQRQVTAKPVTLALYDTAAMVNTNPRVANISIEPDVARAMGRPDLAFDGVSIANDAATYDFGYTVGALPQFRRGQQLEKGLGFAQPPQVVQQAFCPISSEIFRQSGRTLDQTEAFSAGFLQARIDERPNFEGQDIQTGFTAPCPAVTPLPTRQDRINFALVR